MGSTKQSELRGSPGHTSRAMRRAQGHKARLIGRQPRAHTRSYKAATRLGWSLNRHWCSAHPARVRLFGSQHTSKRSAAWPTVPARHQRDPNNAVGLCPTTAPGHSDRPSAHNGIIDLSDPGDFVRKRIFTKQIGFFTDWPGLAPAGAIQIAGSGVLWVGHTHAPLAPVAAAGCRERSRCPTTPLAATRKRIPWAIFCWRAAPSLEATWGLLPIAGAIELAGGPTAPIAIIPAAAAPDHNHQRAGANGVRWFTSLGARAVAAVPLTRPRLGRADRGSGRAAAAAGPIYLLGGFTHYLGQALRGSTACRPR